MGHSWGTYLAIPALKKYPQLFSAYVGISQMVNLLESERLTYHFLLEKTRNTGDGRYFRLLSEQNITSETFPSPRYLGKIKAPLLAKYQVGLTRKPFFVKKMLARLARFKGYSAKEKLNFIRGLSSGEELIEQMKGKDLVSEKLQLEMPIYLFHGAHDRQVSLELSQQFFESLMCPEKSFYVFEQSAHMPHIEEEKEFSEKVTTLLGESNS